MDLKIVNVQTLTGQERYDYLRKISEFMVQNQVQPCEIYSMMLKLFSRPNVAEWIEKMRSDLMSAFLIQRVNTQHWFSAVRGDQIVGAGMMNPNNNPEEFTIVSFFVTPENRGQGIGTQMLASCVEHLKTMPTVSVLMTDSLIDTRMISFFIHHGFAVIPDVGQTLSQRQKDAQTFLSTKPPPSDDEFKTKYPDVIKTGGIAPVIWLGKDLSH